jgi:hypothetical protein
MNVLKALATIVSVCSRQCDPFMKCYTDVFYMIYEGDVPSIHRKTSLDRLSSVGEVESLNLTFIDFYIQRSHHDCNEVKSL